MSVMKIHPTAIIDATAELDSSVEIGPYSIIGANVKIDAGTRIACRPCHHQRPNNYW
jgi:UDP-N-acetylglucosamine acyltransferase